MYAVIFTSRLSAQADGYEEASRTMEDLCRAQPGFVSIESVRAADGRGMTVCIWESLEAIATWGADPQHAEVQRMGIERWYAEYDVKVCEVLDRG